MYEKYVKRLLDIVFSLILIIILSPLYVIIALLVKLEMGSPILFNQERIGKDRKIFKLFKFRSMTNETDENGILLDDSERFTKFGLFLRSTSLDELPELFLILLGKMSFIGPRPQPKYYGPYYTEEELHIYSVRGGLIPPDSLCLEASVDWETQMDCELYYVDNISFLLDIKVFICAFTVIYKRFKTDYGRGSRPHLDEYRAGWNITEESVRLWENK